MVPHILLWCGGTCVDEAGLAVVRQIFGGAAGLTVVQHILMWCDGTCFGEAGLAVIR